MSDDADAVLDFWLRETPSAKRFAEDAALDRAIAARFGALHKRLSDGATAAWSEPRATLAAIIVLDQFSRNLGRGRAAAFANDAVALALTRIALARGDEAGMTDDERQFLLMPLMHSENVADQAESVVRFAALGGEAEAAARAHHAIIERFGRFPHRNAVLGRVSTPQEIEFVAKNPGF